MKIPDRSFEYAKHMVVSNIGNEIGFSSRISRGKILKNKGVISAAYKNIFTIKINFDDKEETLSYSYNDIINNNLVLYTDTQEETV